MVSQDVQMILEVGIQPMIQSNSLLLKPRTGKRQAQSLPFQISELRHLLIESTTILKMPLRKDDENLPILKALVILMTAPEKLRTEQQQHHHHHIPIQRIHTQHMECLTCHTR